MLNNLFNVTFLVFLFSTNTIAQKNNNGEKNQVDSIKITKDTLENYSFIGNRYKIYDSLSIPTGRNTVMRSYWNNPTAIKISIINKVSFAELQKYKSDKKNFFRICSTCIFLDTIKPYNFPTKINPISLSKPFSISQNIISKGAELVISFSEERIGEQTNDFFSAGGTLEKSEKKLFSTKTKIISVKTKGLKKGFYNLKITDVNGDSMYNEGFLIQ